MIYFKQGITELLYSNSPFIADEYSETGEYVIDDMARLGSRIYKSITGIAPNYNTGNNPIFTKDIHWFDYAPANSHALIDLYKETITEWDGDGIIEFSRSGKDTIAIGNFKASNIKIEYLDAISGVVEGMTIATSTDLSSIITAGYAYVDTKRFDLVDIPKLFTAEKDTYVDIDTTGTLVYTEVANGATAPTLTSPNERLAKVVTDTDNITDVEDLRTIIDPVIDAETYIYSNISYINKNSFYNRFAAPFNKRTTKVVFQDIRPVGTNIRVTFSDGGNNTYCGYCAAGIQKYAGDTLSPVSWPTRIKNGKVVKVATFATIMDRKKIDNIKEETSEILYEPLIVVVDPSSNSDFNNMAMIGKILKNDANMSVATKNEINFEVEQNVII